MKTLFFYLCLCIVLPACKNFAQTPELYPIDSLSKWKGDIHDFNLQNKNLVSNGPDSISTISIYQNLNIPPSISWDFELSYGFSPSPSNYSKLYLISDNPPGSDSLNGYYLRVGGITGNSDAVDLFFQKGSEHFKIISGNAGVASRENGSLKIKIELWQNKYWNLYADSSKTGTLHFQGSTIHTNLISSGYTGLEFIYTSSRKDKFVVERFSANPSPQGIQYIEALNDSLLLIILSAQNIDSIKKEDLSINGNFPEEISHKPDSLLCYLDQSLVHGRNSIIIENITVAPFLFEFYPAYKEGSIIINEILFDPEPSAGLPGYEFIELYNQNKFPIQVKGLCISDKNSESCVKDTFSMPAESYLIICPEESRLEYSEFGKAIALYPWPSLNNSGDDLKLIGQNGGIIHQVDYDPSWHNSPTNSSSHSLEMIQPEYYCLDKENWTTSTAQTGGTPGTKNAAFSGNFYPEELKTMDFEYSQNRLSVIFNRKIFKNQSAPIQIDNDPITEFNISEDSLFIEFPYVLGINQNYQINLSGIEDCLGQILPIPNLEITIPGNIKRGDLILNEILFNPGKEGTDFIELFNNSEYFIDLKEYMLSFQGFEQSKFLTYQISEKPWIMNPGGYLVLTGDTSKLYIAHPNTIKKNVLQMKSFPNLTNQGGTLKLLANEKIMELCLYSPEFHNPLLIDQEEVSLERITPNAIATNKENWTSASTNSGYATPGFNNSQNYDLNTKKEVIIDPELFSPDGDGENDLVFIRYQLPGSGWVAKVNIFDRRGYLVKTLNSLTISGTQGYFSWNGQKEDGSIAQMGIYIALIEFFSLEGETRKYRETITIGGKI